MKELEQMLKEGEEALLQQNFQRAEEKYAKVLTGQEEYYRALAYLGLAHLAFLTAKPEEAKKQLFAAIGITTDKKGNKDYGIYEKATALCKQYDPPTLPDLLHNAARIFPLHPTPFIELMKYYMLTCVVPPQRMLLSQMTTNYYRYSASTEEKKQFKDIIKLLAKEHFLYAQANGINPVDLAIDKWTWSFEVENWIKVSEPFYPTVCLTAYTAPNTITGYYIIEPVGITRLTPESYMFDHQQLYIQYTKKPMLDEPHTSGETIDDYIEDAGYIYYNTILMERYKKQIQDFLSRNNEVSQDIFKTFLISLAEEKQTRYN